MLLSHLCVHYTCWRLLCLYVTWKPSNIFSIPTTTRNSSRREKFIDQKSHTKKKKIFLLSFCFFDLHLALSTARSKLACDYIIIEFFSHPHLLLLGDYLLTYKLSLANYLQNTKIMWNLKNLYVKTFYSVNNLKCFFFVYLKK